MQKPGLCKGFEKQLQAARGSIHRRALSADVRMELGAAFLFLPGPSCVVSLPELQTPQRAPFCSDAALAPGNGTTEPGAGSGTCRGVGVGVPAVG